MRVHHVRTGTAEQPAQPQHRQAIPHVRPVTEVHGPELRAIAEAEIPLRLARPEHSAGDAPHRAPGRQHLHVPAGAAGRGAEHECDLHGCPFAVVLMSSPL